MKASEQAAALIEEHVRAWMAALEQEPTDADVYCEAIEQARCEEASGWQTIGAPCFAAITFGRTSPVHYARIVTRRIRPEAGV